MAWERLGGFLGRLGGLSGCLGGHIGRIGAAFGRLGSLLERLRVLLALSCGALWASGAPQGPAHTHTHTLFLRERTISQMRVPEKSPSRQLDNNS